MAIKFLSSENIAGDIDVTLSKNGITYLAVTNTNTGVSANARVQVVGESSQLDLVATSAGYTGVSGWADSGIISTDSGASGGLKLNSQAGGIQLQSGTTSYVTMSASGTVGIGTDSPTARLDVLTNSATGDNNIDRHVRFRADNGEQRFNFFVGRSGNSSNLQMYDSSEVVKVVLNTGDNSYFNGGNVGIGTPSPSDKLQVEGGIIIQNGNNLQWGGLYSAGAPTIFASTDYIQFSPTGTTGAATRSMKLTTTGLGIGTTSPASKLTIDAPVGDFANGTNAISLNYNGGSSPGDVGGGIVFSQKWWSSSAGQQVTGGIFGIKNGGNGSYGGGLAFYTQPNGAASMAQNMIIRSTGEVGIGTDSPQSKLDLLQPDSSANTLGQSVTASLGIRMANAVGQVGQIVFNNDAAPSYGYGSIGMIMTSGTGVGLGDMIFSIKSTGSDSASTERMRIDSNGVIQLTSGINGYLNTNSIGMEMDINRNPETGAFTDAGLSHARIIMRGDTTANGGSNIKFVTSPTVNTVGITKMTITGAGDVGIGTTSPDALLDLESATPALRITDTDNNKPYELRVDAETFSIKEVSNSRTLMSMTTGAVITLDSLGSNTVINTSGAMIVPNGSVGIGMTSPVPKLHLAYSGGSYGTDATSGFINQADTGRATQRIRSITDNASELFFDVNGGIRWDISARGSSSNYNLHFYPQAPVPVYNNVSSHTFQLSQNGDVIVTGAGSSGKFGIGTTSPDTALDVAGASVNQIGAAIIRESSTTAYTATNFNSRPTITLYGINTTNTYVGTRLSHAGNTEFFQGIVKGANNGETTYVWQGYNGSSYQQFGAIGCYGADAGNLVMSGDVVAYSDKKLKKNIKTLDGSKVYKMRGVSFDRIDTGKSSSGVIAQEIQKVAPELVNESDGTLGVAYGNLTGYLIEAIKELKAEIEELKKQIKQ